MSHSKRRPHDKRDNMLIGRPFAPVVVRLTNVEAQIKLDMVQLQIEAVASQLWQSGLDAPGRELSRMAAQVAALKKRVAR